MYYATEYDSNGFDHDGNAKLSPTNPLSPIRSVAIVLAAESINGKILRVARHWALVGSDTKRILIHDNAT